MSRSFLVGLSLAAGLLFVTPVSAAEGDDLVLDLGDVNMELKRVPHGTFTMGSPASEFGHQPDEEPQRLVTITRDYWVGKMPVTKGEFAKFVADSKYVTEAEKGQAGGSGWDGKGLVQKKDFNWRNPGFTQTDDHPVVMVTFADASAFAQWASRKTGKRVRLPTEAEWEFAVRGGTTTPWFAAKTEDEALALGWYKPNSTAGTHPVGQRKANPFGLFDMGGDVFEWCRDIYGPYTKDPVTDPENQVHVGTEPERRVLRGGSWLRLPQRGRSAARYRNAPGARNADNGFRVVVSNDDTLGAGFVSPVDSAMATAADAGANATQAPPAPTPSLDVPAPETSGGGWLLFAAPTGAAAAVLGWIFGRRRTSGSSGSGTSARAIEDGFFVRVAARKGDRVHYACVVGDESLRGDVPYDGAAETFVYTGGRPEAIRIRVVEGEAMREPPPRPVVAPAAPPVVAPIPKPIAPPIEEIEPIDEEEIEPEPVAVRVSAPPPVPRPVSEPPPPRSLSKPPPSRVEEKVPSVIIAAGVEVESAPEPSSPVLQETTEPLVPPGPRSGPISGPVSGPPAPSPTTLASMAAALPATPPPEPEVSAPEIEPEPMSEPIIPAPVISVRDLPMPPSEASVESEAEPLALLPKSAPDVTEERVGPPSRAPLVAEHASALAALDALDEKETAQDLSKMRPITETIKPTAFVELLKGNEEVEDFVGPPTPVPSPLLVAPAPSAPDAEESSDDLEETEQPPAVATNETANEPKMSAKARKRARAAARKAARKKSQSKPDLEDDDKE